MGIPKETLKYFAYKEELAIVVDLELTWQYLLSEFRPKQTKAVLISPFTMGLYGSLYDYVIHAGIIATTCLPLITSFQPPLLLAQR